MRFHLTLKLTVTHRPDIDVVPVYHGVYAHEGGPARVGGIKVGEVLAVGVRPAGAHEDGLHGGGVVQVVCEGGLHGLCVLEELQGVGLDGDGNKVLDFLEGVCCLDVNTFDGGVGVAVGVRRREALAV